MPAGAWCTAHHRDRTVPRVQEPLAPVVVGGTRASAERPAGWRVMRALARPRRHAELPKTEDVAAARHRGTAQRATAVSTQPAAK